MYEIQKDYLVFDIEVFPHWWCVCFSTLNEFTYHYTSDDYSLSIMSEIVFNNILVGFNIKNYDLKILNAILRDESPERIYQLSKNIIKEKPDTLDNISFWNRFLFTDLFDDWKNGSLKEFESNQGMSIEESMISFDKDDLTDLDKANTLKYCYHDVKATVKLFNYRWEKYLSAKLELAKLFDINPYKALKSTNAKLASIILNAKKVDREENLNYVIPSRVEAYIKENVPNDVLEAFKILNYDDKVFNIYDNEVKFGIGGIHSTYCNKLYTKTDDEYQLINVDVTSYYPNLLMKFKYMSRNVSNPKIYEDIYVLRRKLKQDAKEEKEHNGKTERYVQLMAAQEGLKLILNTVYGAMKNKYNELYDPYNAGSLCYTGQLLLTALASKIHKNIFGIKIIQTNTDGILVKCPKNQIENLYKLVGEWESLVGFTMEYDYIEAFYQRDVNNYIEVTGNPKDPYKLKGKWSNQAFIDDVESNLNAPITHNAILKYYVHNIPVENTIYECKTPLDFCFTCKTGKSYSGTYYETDNSITQTNKVNRVIAVKDASKGTLYKYKPETETPTKITKQYLKKVELFVNKFNLPYGRMDKIAEIPEHCKLINNEPYIPEDIDKEWYIKFCYDKIKELVYV